MTSLTAPKTGTPAAPAPPRRPRLAWGRRLTPYGLSDPDDRAESWVLMVVPIIMVIGYSFRDNVIISEDSVFAGFANYAKVLSDPDFVVALKNTAVFITVSMVAHLLLGLGFAMMLNSPLLGGVTKAIFRIVYILPWLFTIAVIAVIWRLLLDPAGVLNYLLHAFGLIQQNVDWLGDPAKALWVVTFVNIWSGYPFFMISLLAGLQGIPHDLYEAAAVDGANPWQKFRSVDPPAVAAGDHQHGRTGPDLDLPAVRADLDDDRRRTAEQHRDAQHLHLQAGLQRVRVLDRLGRGRGRAAADDDPGLLLRTPAAGEVSSMVVIANRRPRKTLAKAGLLAGLVLGGLFAGLPVLWMLSTSFKANGDVFANPPKLITENFSLDAYREIFGNGEQLRFFLNSYIVAIAVTVLTLLVAIMAGYAFSRFRFPLQGTINAAHHQRAGRAADHARHPVLRAGGRARSLQHLRRADPHPHGVHPPVRDHHDHRVSEHPAPGTRRVGQGGRRAAAGPRCGGSWCRSRCPA